MDDEYFGSGSECVQFIGNLQGLWPIRSPEIDENICINLVSQNPCTFRLQWENSLLSIISISIWIKLHLPWRWWQDFPSKLWNKHLIAYNNWNILQFSVFPIFVSHRTKYSYIILISLNSNLFTTKPLLSTTVRSIMTKAKLWTNIAFKQLAPLFTFENSRFQIPARKRALLTQNFHTFPQLLHAAQE